ncbi:hypothetical protein JQ615_37800 [Bradyrhizobium jicamae]|uniref:Uncharacterized protein n=1 Tax=Bradyrhizobium jicamae TaxID=280332 RepID=A0ABS5FWA6_9BRAD|nr:hypothetical protein [Bradyrhizobium jicamae]MBR0801127.1 hypothetical protein [Bradyrhizobium jicamae]
MIKRGLSVFDPPKDLVDASGVTPKLGEDERVIWIGTPGWFSTFFCSTAVPTWGALFLALFAYHGIYALTPEQYAIEGLVKGRWIVVGVIVIFAFIPQLMALRIGDAFVYILTTERMMVKVDQTRMLVRLLRYFRTVADPDGFAAYDLRYLNGARVYAGLWRYGNVSVRSFVGSFGELRHEIYESEPVFRDRRFVKIWRRLPHFRLAETPCNVYFGIKDVDRLGDVLNDQCAADIQRLASQRR